MPGHRDGGAVRVVAHGAVAAGVAGEPGACPGWAAGWRRLVVKGVELDGGWILRGGRYIELGEEAEWFAGWVAEPAGAKKKMVDLR